MSDYLAHYGRKGMKWGKHIFGKGRRLNTKAVYLRGNSSNSTESSVSGKQIQKAPYSDKINEGKLEREHQIRQDMHSRRAKPLGDSLGASVPYYREKSENAARAGDNVNRGRYTRMAIAGQRINSKEVNFLKRWGKEALYEWGILGRTR